MFDRFDAGVEGGGDAGFAVDVAGYCTFGTRGFFDDSGHLLLVELLV